MDQIAEETSALLRADILTETINHEPFHQRKAHNESYSTSVNRANLVHGPLQQGVDCEPTPPSGITCALFHAVGLAGAVMIIKAGL